MEDDKDIDKIFKSTIEPYEMEPTERVWSSLEASLKKKKPSGFGIKGRIISLTLILIFISGVTYEILAPASYFNSGDNQLESSAPENRKDQNNIYINNYQKKSDTNYLANGNVSVINASGSNTSKLKNHSSIKAKDVNTSSSPLKNDQTSTNLVQSANESSPSNENTAGAKLASQSSESSQKVNTIKPDENTDNTIGDNQSGEPTEVEKPLFPAEEVMEKAATPPDHSADSLSKLVNDAPIPSKAVIINSKNPVSFMNRMKQRLSIDAFYAPEIANRTMSTNSLGTQNAGTTTTESFSSSFNTGALLRVDLNNKLSVSLGASYSTLDYFSSVTSNFIVPKSDTSSHGLGGPGGPNHNQFPPNDHDSSFNHDFQDTSFFQDHFTSTGNNSFDYNNSCGTVLLQGTPSVPIPASSQPGSIIAFTTATRIHLEYINIPLAVNFKLSSKKFDYYISSGLSLNILIKKSATVNIADTYLETTTDISGLTKTNFSYMFSTGIRYHLYDNMGIFIEPSYRKNITSITQDSSNGFYPYYFGLKMGLSLHF